MLYPTAKAPLRAVFLVPHTVAFLARIPDALSGFLTQRFRLFASDRGRRDLYAQVFCGAVPVNLHQQLGA